ncbi:MAG: TonB-dependent receptor [Spirochaetes bacterium]|nr:TonB-dependent receptor [Spirochaetota bacterium]
MKQLFPAIALTCFILLCLPVTGFSEDNEVSLGKVVVTSEPVKTDVLSYETGDVPVDEITSFVQVITREKFEGKMEDLSEVIEKEAGIQVRKAGGLGSFASVSIRGSTTEQVLVFIDGVLLNEASGGGVDLSNISLADVESIEIYRGITPLQFGMASIGGAINIRTRRTGDKKLVLSANAGYGSFTTTQAGFFMNYKPGNFDYLVSADFLGSKGDFYFQNKYGQTESSENWEWQHRNNNQFNQYNLLGKAGYNFTDNVRLYFSNQFFGKDQALPYWNNSENVYASLKTYRDIAILKFIADNLTSLNINSASRLQYTWKKEIYDDSAEPSGSIGLGMQYSEYYTQDLGLNQLFEITLPYNIVTAVADIKYEGFRHKDLLNDITIKPSWRTIMSAAIEDNILLFREKLSLIPCIRYYYITDKLQDSNYTTASVEENDYFSPKFGFLFKPVNWIRFKGNVAEYYREPTFSELFGDRGFTTGNVDLKPEKGLNKDIGFELAFQIKNNFFLQRLNFEMVYFESDIEDLIVFIYDARGIGKAQNLSDAEIKGVETTVSIDLFKYFQLSCNYTRQYPVSHSNIDYKDEGKLPGRYEKALTSRLEMVIPFGMIYYEIHYESGLNYEEAGLLITESKNEHTAGLKLKWSNYMLNFEVKNITNDEYLDYKNYPEPGRAYYLTLKYNY